MRQVERQVSGWSRWNGEGLTLLLLTFLLPIVFLVGAGGTLLARVACWSAFVPFQVLMLAAVLFRRSALVRTTSVPSGEMAPELARGLEGRGYTVDDVDRSGRLRVPFLDMLMHDHALMIEGTGVRVYLDATRGRVRTGPRTRRSLGSTVTVRPVNGRTWEVVGEVQDVVDGWVRQRETGTSRVHRTRDDG